MKNQSRKKSIYNLLFFVIAIVLVMYPTGKIYAQPAISVKIDEWFSNSQEIFPFVKTDKIHKLAISGSIQLHKDNSLIRVILVGDDFHEYLVYEAYPLIVDNDSVNIINKCEETCIIDGISPHSLKMELIESSLQIYEMALTVFPPSLTMELAKAQIQIKKQRDADKTEKLNENIKKKGLKWIAGETSVSKLFYEEKKKLFGGDRVPNLQGFEYYKGGVFEIKSEDNSSSFGGDEADSPSLSDNGGSSLIESFDWRNRHGADDPASPYYDGDPTESGWITPVRNQGGCGSCWAFAAVGATEAVANLYFNQHLDVDYGLDLSEQDILSCSGCGSCAGGYIHCAMDYIENTGVVDEGCFPYTASDEPCGNKCVNPNEQIKISESGAFSYDDWHLKTAIIDYGPITMGIKSWWHFMVLVGFDKDNTTGETIWVFKNSWGSGWGDNGYGSIKVPESDRYGQDGITTVISLKTPFEIACNDFDGDGYYNWGISAIKPASCPSSALPDKDCDDNNSSLGPFDTDGHCVPIIKFVDVPPGYWAEKHIYKIYEAGITKGCSQNPMLYCPKKEVTRDQMAAFLVRAVDGEPPANYCGSGSPFSDVSPSDNFCKYIKKLSELGITQGCGGDKYCPKTTVKRDQMAAFLVRAVDGEPPADYCDAGSPFSDVDPGSNFCKYIKKLSELGITQGCGGGKYCPKTIVKRDQMAVFLGRAFLGMN